MKLTVATSSTHTLFEKCLKRNGIYDLFDSFTETHEVERGKGYPDVYELAALRCQTDTAHCIVFEDNFKGSAGRQKKGGFYTVAVYDAASAQEQEEIKKLCDRYIYGYEELE